MRVESWFRALPIRLRSLFRRNRTEQDLDDEIRYHLETEAERYTSDGMDPDAARRLVMQSFGNIESVKEHCRDARGTRLLETIAADARYGVRTLGRTPAFTAVAVVTLALGIGANSAVFSLADGILLSPLPYADAGRLVSVTGTYPGGAFSALRGEIRAMDVATYAEGHSFTLSGDGERVRVPGTLVSAELLPLLGAKPELGRWPREGEDVSPRDRVVILSHALWAARFHADPAIVGRFVDVDDVRREIIAVMPPSFRFPSNRTEIWVPLGLDSRDTKRYWAGDFMPVIGRLRPGASVARAVDEIRAFQHRVPALFPWPMPADWNRDVGVIPLGEAIVGDVRARVLILLAAVGVVLVIACANVANLSLSRAVAREREIGIRAALGASPGRISRQLFTESVVLAVAGAAAGWLVAGLAMGLLKRVLPPDTPRLDEVTLNGRALLASGALALLTGCAFGCAPVLHARRLGLRTALESGGRGASAASGRLRAALTIAQVACAVLLVIAAGLLVRSLWGLSHVDSGFRSSGIVTARVSPAESICAAPDRCLAFYRQLETAIHESPDVQGVAFVNTLPLTGAVAKRTLDLEGYTVPASKPAPLFWLNVVTQDYFRVMGIRVEAGRSFTPADLTGHPVSVIVSAATARRFWPGENPVGRHVRFDSDAYWRTVVGVAADVHAYDLTRTVPDWISGTVYAPQALNATQENGQLPSDMTAVLRTTRDPAQATVLLRQAAGRGDVVVEEGRPMQAIVSEAAAAPAATASLLAAMAALAVALGCVGVYGVLSFLVTRQLRDFGIRVALGAQRFDVLRVLLGQAAVLCFAGVAIGVAGAFALTRWLSSELYGVSPTDPLTYAAVSAAVALTTLAASCVPARRALGVDPLTILREP